MATSITTTVAATSQTNSSEQLQQQQRTRYFALKARLDELTAGTEWVSHRGKGVSHVIAHIQSRPLHHCCPHSALDSPCPQQEEDDRQHEEFAAPETFDDDDSSDLSSDGSDESNSSLCSPDLSHGSGVTPQHDSSASSQIIYLSQPHHDSGTPTTPLSVLAHRTSTSCQVQQLSPIPHTPTTDSSSSSSSSCSSEQTPVSSSASSQWSNSSKSESAGLTTRRARSHRRAHFPLLPSTPISASMDHQRQTLSVYWPWPHNDSATAAAERIDEQMELKDSTPAKQEMERIEYKSEEQPHDEQSEAAEAEEMEPGMPAEHALAPQQWPSVARLRRSLTRSNSSLSLGASAVGVEECKDGLQTVEMEDVLQSADGHTQDNAKDECAEDAQACDSSQEARFREEQAESTGAQQQLNSTRSSFAVAAADLPEDSADSAELCPGSGKRSPVEHECERIENEEEQLAQLNTEDEAIETVEVGEDDEQLWAESPAVSIRCANARRRVLVSDDEDDSHTEGEAAAQRDKQCVDVAIEEKEEEGLDRSAEVDSSVIAPRRGNSRRRQIVSDEEEGEPIEQRTPQLARPLQRQSPLRDITNQQHSNSRPITQPFASPPHKAQHSSTFMFATPAARPPTSRLPAASHFTHAVDGSRQTRSATRRDNRVCDEDEMDLYATPMIERIRQHKAALYNKQIEEEEDEQEEQEAEEQDEYDQSFIASESDADYDDGDSYIHEESDEQSPHGSRHPPSRSHIPAPTKRPLPPATTSKAVTASCPKDCPALTKHNRLQLAREVYTTFNHAAFTNRLPADLTIEWCNKLTTTAGHCRLMTSGGSGRGCIITLAVKVIDSYERLRKTLAHELCHAAAWLIDGCNRPPHGRTFRHYAQLCERRLPAITVSTCHTYAIYYPWRYRCTSSYCGQEVGRHTDSLDVEVSRCGRCGGRLVRLGKFARDGTPVAVRQATGFAAFVKSQQARVRAENPGTPQREVMALLSTEWKRQRAIATAAARLTEEEDEGKGAGEEDQLVQRMLDLDVVEE